MLATVGLVSAMAAPALAGATGTVFGQASLQPYAIEVTGGGITLDTALAYSGTYDSGARGEDFGRTITVTNVGSETCDFTVAGDRQPTNGSVTWTFGHDAPGGWVDEPGPAAAVWRFSPQAGKTANDFGVGRVFAVPVRKDTPRALASDVPSGVSVTYDSSFQFPTASTGIGTFEMSAVVSAIAR